MEKILISQLSGEAINKASDRHAMLLPERHVIASGEFSEKMFGSLIQTDPKILLQILMNPDKHISTRFAAGTLLALVGDPRLSVFEPEMVTIPGGSFTLGLPESQVDHVLEKFKDTGILREWIEKECPAYSVELSSFRIGKYPITNFEYRAFLLATDNPAIPSSWPFGRMPEHLANRPVYGLGPQAADDYAKWLSNTTGRKFRLPTEAEWEAAAAGPEGREFPWGDNFHKELTNTLESGFLTTTPIGMFPAGATPEGVHELAGNVEEYVLDEYRPYPGGAYICDDLTKATKNYKVARGGSFTRFRDLARCRRRHGYFPRTIYVMGFRLAEDFV